MVQYQIINIFQPTLEFLTFTGENFEDLRRKTIRRCWELLVPQSDVRRGARQFSLARFSSAEVGKMTKCVGDKDSKLGEKMKRHNKIGSPELHNGYCGGKEISDN